VLDAVFKDFLGMSENQIEKEKAYEERLRRRLDVLLEQFAAGKITIAPGLKVIDSLKAVMRGPDGVIDLDTVDGLVRSMAMLVTEEHDRDVLKKKFPLSQLQLSYFSLIEKNFGEYFDEMLKAGVTPHEVATAISNEQSVIGTLVGQLDGFLDVIEEFWEQTADIVFGHVDDMQETTKGIFGGDLFPSLGDNIVSKCGLYIDTIVLPDPFLRSRMVFRTYPDKEKVYYLIRHGLSLMHFKSLACADVDPPIVVVLPETQSLDEAEKKFTLELGKSDALIHTAKLFGREFSSFEEMIEFCESLDNVTDAAAAVVDNSRVLFDTEWQGSVSDQIERALADENYKLIGGHPGRLLAQQSVSRMGVSNELLIKSQRLKGNPIIEVPTSWQYLVWKMDYDAEKAEVETGKEGLHVTRGLQSLAEEEMQWLGNIPPEALIEMREQGAMDKIRDTLSKGIEELVRANPTNYHRSRDQVFDNIHEAFDCHRENIKDLQAKGMKFAGQDLGSWLVTGSLAVSAVATGAVVWGLAAIAANQLLDAPKLKDIPRKIKKLADENRKLNRSPVGLLFNVRNKCN
jgi:hypothetical protein